MITDVLTETEKELVEKLNDADPGTRFKMCCNLARSNESGWMIIGYLKDSTMLELVRDELAKEKKEAEKPTITSDKLVADRTRAKYFPLGNAPAMQ